MFIFVFFLFIFRFIYNNDDINNDCEFPEGGWHRHLSIFPHDELEMLRIRLFSKTESGALNCSNSIMKLLEKTQLSRYEQMIVLMDDKKEYYEDLIGKLDLSIKK